MSIDSFSTSELDILKQILSDVSQIKKDKMTVKQVRNMVPVEDWINDEYYVGKSGMFLYPYWKDQIIDIFGKNKGLYNEVIITGGIGCLTLNHMYDTSLGLRTLLQVKELLESGEKVYVDTESGVSEVIGAHIKGEEPTKRIKFSNGFSIEGTLNHRIRVLENGELVWKELRDLEKGDVIPFLEKTSPFEGIEYDIHKSYILGYLIGDGCISKNTHGNRTQFTLMFDTEQSNSEYLTVMGQSLFGTDHCTEREFRSGKVFRYVRATNHELSKEWQIYDSDGLKVIPEFVHSLSVKDKGQFIAGLFDSDGHMSRDSIEITFKSERLIQSLQRLLSSIGVFSTYTSKRTSCRYKG